MEIDSGRNESSQIVILMTIPLLSNKKMTPIFAFPVCYFNYNITILFGGKIRDLSLFLRIPKVPKPWPNLR
jgi:hypothetical protein